MRAMSAFWLVETCLKWRVTLRVAFSVTGREGVKLTSSHICVVVFEWGHPPSNPFVAWHIILHSVNIGGVNDSRIAAVQRFINMCALFHPWGGWGMVGQRLRL